MSFVITFIVSAVALNLFAVWIFGSLSPKAVFGFIVLAFLLSAGAIPQKKQKSEKQKKLERDLLYHDIKMYKKNAEKQQERH